MGEEKCRNPAVINRQYSPSATNGLNSAQSANNDESSMSVLPACATHTTKTATLNSDQPVRDVRTLSGPGAGHGPPGGPGQATSHRLRLHRAGAAQAVEAMLTHRRRSQAFGVVGRPHRLQARPGAIGMPVAGDHRPALRESCAQLISTLDDDGVDGTVAGPVAVVAMASTTFCDGIGDHHRRWCAGGSGAGSGRR